MRDPSAAQSARRYLFWGALALLAFAPMDPWLLGRFSPAPLGVRVGSAALLLALYGWMPRARPALRPVLVRTGLVGLVLSLVGLLAVTGGAESYLLPWMMAIPGLLVATTPGYARVQRETSITLAVGVTAVLLLQGEPLSQVAAMALAFATLLWFLAKARHSFERWARRMVAAEQARTEAAARLVESERARLRAERYSAVGRLAGEVAHEINNPLAALKANLGFVREAVQAGLPDEDRAEVLEALQDGLEAVDRIAAGVVRLRTHPDARGDASADTEVPAA